MNGEKTGKRGRLPSAAERWRRRFLNDSAAAVDERLSELETLFTEGNRAALALAIRICAQSERALPKWVADAWVEACNAVYGSQVRGWDEALGHDPPATEKQFARKRNDALLAERLINLLPFLRDEPVDDNFFAVIANHLEISERRARTLYYELPERFRLPQMKARKPPRKRNVPAK